MRRTVTVRDLRNHGGDVLERVVAGETITVTRGGRPVARLEPVRPRAIGAAELLERWARLPKIDPSRFLADLDTVIDQDLE